MKALTLGVWLIFTVGLVAVTVAFISQNGEPINLSLFHYTSDAYPKWLMFVIGVLVGVTLASLFFVFELVVLQTRTIRLRRINRKLEKAMGIHPGKNNTNDTDTEHDKDSDEPILSKAVPSFKEEEV